MSWLTNHLNEEQGLPPSRESTIAQYPDNEDILEAYEMAKPAPSWLSRAFRGSATGILLGQGLSDKEQKRIQREREDNPSFLLDSFESLLQTGFDLPVFLGAGAAGTAAGGPVAGAAAGFGSVTAIKETYAKYLQARERGDTSLSFSDWLDVAKETGKSAALGAGLGVLSPRIAALVKENPIAQKLFNTPIKREVAESLLESGYFTGAGAAIGHGDLSFESFRDNLFQIAGMRLGNAAVRRLFKEHQETGKSPQQLLIEYKPQQESAKPIDKRRQIGYDEPVRGTIEIADDTIRMEPRIETRPNRLIPQLPAEKAIRVEPTEQQARQAESIGERKERQKTLVQAIKKENQRRNELGLEKLKEKQILSDLLESTRDLTEATTKLRDVREEDLFKIRNRENPRVEQKEVPRVSAESKTREIENERLATDAKQTLKDRETAKAERRVAEKSQSQEKEVGRQEQLRREIDELKARRDQIKGNSQKALKERLPLTKQINERELELYQLKKGKSAKSLKKETQFPQSLEKPSVKEKSSPSGFYNEYPYSLIQDDPLYKNYSNLVAKYNIEKEYAKNIKNPEAKKKYDNYLKGLKKRIESDRINVFDRAKQLSPKKGEYKLSEDRNKQKNELIAILDDALFDPPRSEYLNIKLPHGEFKILNNPESLIQAYKYATSREYPGERIKPKEAADSLKRRLKDKNFAGAAQEAARDIANDIVEQMGKDLYADFKGEIKSEMERFATKKEIRDLECL